MGHVIGRVAVATFAVCLAACATSSGPSGPGWRSLFDGRTLNGWTPKIRGFPLGENYLDTYSAGNGVLKVSYDKYDKFGERYGHLFYKTPFKAYKLRLEYRFIGKTPADTPGWAIANNGVMIFSQDPKTMAVGDSFPVSVEAQILGLSRWPEAHQWQHVLARHQRGDGWQADHRALHQLSRSGCAEWRVGEVRG